MFRDAAEVSAHLGAVFEAAFADPEVGPRLKETGVVLKIVYTEPDAVVVVDCAAGVAMPGEEATPSTVEMLMSAATGNAYWQGKVHLPAAMATGAIRVRGDVAALLPLLPLGKHLHARYVATSKARGRDDLLVRMAEAA